MDLDGSNSHVAKEGSSTIDYYNILEKRVRVLQESLDLYKQAFVYLIVAQSVLVGSVAGNPLLSQSQKISIIRISVIGILSGVLGFGFWMQYVWRIHEFYERYIVAVWLLQNQNKVTNLSYLESKWNRRMTLIASAISLACFAIALSDILQTLSTMNK